MSYKHIYFNSIIVFIIFQIVACQHDLPGIPEPEGINNLSFGRVFFDRPYTVIAETPALEARLQIKGLETWLSYKILIWMVSWISLQLSTALHHFYITMNSLVKMVFPKEKWNQNQSTTLHRPKAFVLIVMVLLSLKLQM